MDVSEYDALSRLGITEGSQYLKKRFQKYEVKFLPTCCVGESLVNQVEIAVSEAISSGEWVDILVSGVSDSMKQLAVYYSCSLSMFLCKLWLLLWSCIIDDGNTSN